MKKSIRNNSILSLQKELGGRNGIARKGKTWINANLFIEFMGRLIKDAGWITKNLYIFKR
jgi:hypothetical protein